MNRSDWTPGDENVSRLLGRVYDPLPVPAAFSRRVQARLLEVAEEMARRHASAPRRCSSRRRQTALARIAALLGIVALGLRFLPRPASPRFPPDSGPLVRATAAAPLPAPARASLLNPGAILATHAGERRRVALSDGSVLSVNQNTTLHYDSPRHLTLKAGEIFVEVAPRLAAGAAALFTVETPHRAVRSVDTTFLVRTDDEGTDVTVARGQVHVSDCETMLVAGQQIAPQSSAVTPTPRLSYLLDWARDLVASASPILVPPSAHAGGSLVAADSEGHADPLTMRKCHIDVYIEDGFARTTIDQTYFNHTLGRLEGTFFFPLPPGASLSRLAMYVDGQLMEGGMAEREYARRVFEQIVTKMKDPALLEWVDGRTFKMRVFPLEARQEKRIILSYTQRLPGLYGRLSYRFPAGHSLGAVRDWSFHARVKDGAKIEWRCDSHNLTPSVGQGDLSLDASARQAAMDRDLVLDLCEPSGVDAARFSSAEQDRFRYVMLRYRPDLPGTGRRQRRDWVFLFESSADRDLLLARTQAEVVRTLLANSERDDTFAVLTADTQVRRFSPAPLAVTPENIAGALAFLDHAHLLGALDLDAGLTAAAESLRGSRNPVLVHLGSGQAVLGERHEEALASRIPAGVCYVGVGVGKHWSHNFMHRAAERCQGYVTEINPDEPVAWRAFDLLATLNTPRLLGVRVTDPAGKAQFLCPGSILAQGEELCAIARLPAGARLPKSVRITGTIDGRPYQRELSISSPHPGANYLPRTWARLEIDRLLAEDAAKNKGTIVALSKAMYVMTPYTSLLVLENEAMYAQYKVDHGRKDHWAMYPCPPKIPVVYEPLSPSEMDAQKSLRAPIELLPPGIERTAQSVQSDEALYERIRRQYRMSNDWAIQYDPVTGQRISLSNGYWAEGLNPENNQLGFYPPSQALTVKAASTIHSRAGSRIVPPGGLTIANFADGTSNTLFFSERNSNSFFTYNPRLPTPLLGKLNMNSTADGSIYYLLLPYIEFNDTGLADGSVRYVLPRPQEWSYWFIAPEQSTVNPPILQLREVCSIPDGADPEAGERLLSALLADPTQAKRPALWRQAARVAEQRKQYEIAVKRLARALELEARQPSLSADLVSFRCDYTWLLSLAHQRVKELISLHRSMPRDLLDRVVGIADRWRAVDPEDWAPCWLAGRILWLAGERELAWSYLTTPRYVKDGKAAGWLELARQQYWQGAYDLAERAFTVASSLDPNDAAIARERAHNHRAAGREDEARKLLQKIPATDW
jgi:ferric-dicitrate binding protein FerR (iron transport regulator)/tetratricopeptide (TPR) repeat protein